MYTQHQVAFSCPHGAHAVATQVCCSQFGPPSRFGASSLPAAGRGEVLSSEGARASQLLGCRGAVLSVAWCRAGSVAEHETFQIGACLRQRP